MGIMKFLFVFFGYWITLELKNDSSTNSLSPVAHGFFFFIDVCHSVGISGKM